MKTKLIVSLILLINIFACRPSTTETTTENEEEGKNITEITYYDLLKEVFEDDGYGIEYHGEALPNEFIESLMITKEGLCGSGGCGEGLFIVNSSAADTLEIIVNGAYDLEGNIGNIARQYVIPANGKVSIGCSHLCFEGTPYAFERKIVGSKKFIEKEI